MYLFFVAIDYCTIYSFMKISSKSLYLMNQGLFSDVLRFKFCLSSPLLWPLPFNLVILNLPVETKP